MNHPDTNAIQLLFTPYEPVIRSERRKSGLVHPGVGLTADHLRTVQKQVREGKEPWKTYFQHMLASESASETPEIRLTDPEGTAFSSKGTNSRFIRDGLTAYTQAILYLVTGNAGYRANALTILRCWSALKPEEFGYFPDAHIHVGIPMNRMCMAAEMIRYSTYEVTEAYQHEDLCWTEEEIAAFCDHLLRPAIDTFHSDCSGFMNQHLYTVIGAMSAYLFLDDREGYEKTVEWFTVNRNAANPGFNGSIRRLFRKIVTADEVGQPEGSGKLLPRPVIQHVEMGRDQAHGCGDLTNAAILARMVMAQNTKVDPADGTVSDRADAVGIYEFDDDRILCAADFFFQYMLGYPSEWVQVPFSIRNGVIADNYTDFSPMYRGRYRTINFWDLYVYYRYRRHDTDLARDYPYFYEGFLKKVPSLYFSKGKPVVNWDNVDGGSDFWMFLPEEAAGDESLLAEPQRCYRSEAEDRGVMLSGSMSVGRYGDTGYVRFTGTGTSVLAMTDSGTDAKTAALRIRTDGCGKLTISGVKNPILLPDTGGEWKYVLCTCGETESLGDFYTLTVSDLTGSYADLDAVDIMPDEPNEERDAIVRLCFRQVPGTLIAVRNTPVPISFTAETSDPAHPVTYRADGLPENAVLDPSSGVLTWTPADGGEYSFRITASAGETMAVIPFAAAVCDDRKSALAKASRDPSDCTRESADAYRSAYRAAEEGMNTCTDGEFASLLERFCRAAGDLVPLNPLLTDDPLTDGTSIDYGKMVRESTMGEELCNLIDPEGTFCGYYKAVDRAHILDFGEAYRISVTKFGFRARLGFSDRLAGVQVFGSNDRENWICLTEQEAGYSQYYQEIRVKPGLTHCRFRYLKLCKTTEYPDALRGNIHGLLEFGVMRIWGKRFETD